MYDNATSQLIFSSDFTELTKTNASFPDRIRDEIGWYRAMPPKFLKTWCPEIKTTDMDLSGNSPNLTLRYISAPPVEDVILRRQDKHAIILDKFVRLLQDLKNIPVTNIPFNYRLGALESYVVTAKRAVKQCLEDEKFSRFFNKFELHREWKHCPQGYGVKLMGLADVLYFLESEKISVEDNFYPGCIHGNLYLDNILFDEETDKLTVVDPDGRFGMPGHVGDINIDIAKLRLSIEHNVCLFSRNRYEIIESKYRPICLRSDTDYNWDRFRQMFAEHPFFNNNQNNYSTLLCALLLLSNVPFCKSHKLQQALVIQGLEIFNNFLTYSLSSRPKII